MPHSSAAKKPAHPEKAQCAAPKSPREARCLSLKRTDVAGRRGLQRSSTPSGYGPTELQSAYDLPSATAGGGATVAIVDAYDDPTAEADLAVYRSQYGLPPCTTENGCFKKVNQQGQSAPLPASDAGWSGEIALDVDMVSAACPNCNILLVEGDDANLDSLAEAVQTAVDLGAKYVSNSYGAAEDSADLDYNTAYNHPGVVVTASTGDDGYGTEFPSTVPGVTAVGGTSLVQDGSSRGWTETAWAGAGSGCSTVQDKPTFQTDTGCGKRSVADVSAVADPQTGVATYNTTGDSGWGVFGGTSASSPIIASVYALAGQPVDNTDPESYPWAKTTDLNDVVSGNNGVCDPSYLCMSGTGYDGPTGLGTPNGVAAFKSGPVGTLKGTVTDKATGKPLAGAKVSAGTTSVVTKANGTYAMAVPTGTYSLKVASYGYRAAAKSITVVEDQTLTESFALATVPSHTVSGVVRDGTAHKYPLYAKITAVGTPGAPVYSDPKTGAYSLDLPQGSTYTLKAEPVLTGYDASSTNVRVGAADITHNIAVKVADSCDAPGYVMKYSSPITDFENGVPSAWSVTDNAGSGSVWTTDDVGDIGNLTGGSGKFAVVDSNSAGNGVDQDTELTSPVMDLSNIANPVVDLDSAYKGWVAGTADIDYTVDGGKTWSNVWEQTTGSTQGPLSVALPDAANKSAVQVRFHYTGSYGYYWEVDNVLIGSATCTPQPGGLVVGEVTDGNTGEGVVGGVVQSDDVAADTARTLATPDDPAKPDGLYLVYSSKAGAHGFTATAPHYASAKQTPSVVHNGVVSADFALSAGKVTVKPLKVSGSATLGGAASTTFKLTNTGAVAAHVTLDEGDGGVTIAGKPAKDVYQGARGAPKKLVKGTYSKTRMQRHAKPAKPTKVAPKNVTPAAGPWTSIADFPTAISDNSVTAHNGDIYSVGGYDGASDLASFYEYAPDTKSWSKLADLPTTVEAPASGWINGKLYVSGGWGPTGSATGGTFAYDPVSKSWTTVASDPKPHAGAGSSVWQGKLYVVGGCDATCGSTDVQVYDPATDSWSQGPAFPVAAAWGSCGGIDELYCAGGGADADATKGWAFDGSTWTPIADLPAGVWGSAYGVANGQLVVTGGVIGGAATNQGWAYDPATDAWTALPNSNNAFYRGGGACGFYKVGGTAGILDPQAASEVLPGYADCASDGVDVPWLSESSADLSLAPGASKTVSVQMDSRVLSQPGTYKASIIASTDTPYAVPAIPATFTVGAPSTWSKITGTVKGASCAADPVALGGATVEVDSWVANYTLTTTADGTYELWLDRRSNPLTLIVAKDGWSPQTVKAKLVKGKPLTVDFTLKPAKACS